MTKSRTKDIVYIAMFAMIIAVCSWISIPTVIPFTLQTFGVFLTVSLLGGKRGTASVAIYLLLGLIGVPVFANFKSGIGTLLGATGGYIIGFIFTAIVMWAFERICIKRAWFLPVAMAIGLLVCYAFGTAWFMIVYAKTSGTMGIWSALTLCVFPYLLPDAAKIALATLLTKRLRKVIDRDN